MSASPAVRRNRRLIALLLLAAGGLFAAGGLARGPFEEHEALVAETSREMLERGDWVVPHFAGAPRIRKTPLGYWLVAATARRPEGVNEATTRLPSALFGAGTVACVYLIARRMGGRRFGLRAALAATSTAGVAVYAMDGKVEALLTLCCAAAYACFVEWQRARALPAGRWWARGFYVAFALSLLAKFPMGGVVVGAPVAVYALLMLLRRRWGWRDLLQLRIIEGSFITVALCAPWPILVARSVPQALEHWESEILDRYSGDLRDTQWRASNLTYYPLALLGYGLPWSLALPLLLSRRVRTAIRATTDDRLLLLCWLGVSVVVLSGSAFQRAHYVAPSVPAFVLLATLVYDAWKREQTAEWPGISPGAVAGLGLVGLAVYVAIERAEPDPRPQLRALGAAIAQTVPADHEVRWLGRHEAPVVFYGAGRLVAPRLDDPHEVLPHMIAEMPSQFEWQLLVADKVIERLSEPRPIWIVLRELEFNLLRSAKEVPGWVALENRIPGSDNPYLLLTNQHLGKPAESYSSELPIE